MKNLNTKMEEKNYQTKKNVIKNGYPTEQSAFMEPLDSLDIIPSFTTEHNLEENIRNVSSDFKSLNVHQQNSFLLIDQEENLKINSIDEFQENLQCHNSLLKVISIFGNSGDGKSYCMNNLFFKGNQVFKTSKFAEQGTRGVWAAWHGPKNLLCLDTPPLHYSNSSDILLLKILAISDIVIYITRSERLPEDLFTFVGQAAKALNENFKGVLQKVGHKIENGGSASTRGPALFICHEPLHSFPLSQGNNGESPEDRIKAKFNHMKINIDIFGTLRYISMHPSNMSQSSSSSFTELMKCIKLCLENTAIRSPRSPEKIYETIKLLLSRFRGSLTCNVNCIACQAVCCLSMGHEEEGIKHSSQEKCRYQHQYDNKEYICRECRKTVKVIEQSQETWLSYARSAWNGYELCCPQCGPIYKSRQYWFGNLSPENTVVYTKFVHVWNGNANYGKVNNVGVRRALEGVGNLVNTAYIYSTDYIAPSYWQPNSEITKCTVCESKLEVGSGEVHHCRDCGMGVCNSCSLSRLSVPYRGWDSPVRVCDRCKNASITGNVEESKDINVRKASEFVVSALKPLSVALNFPKGMITELARPSYWIPDEDAPVCALCNIIFGIEIENARHHCRRCGQSICKKCSPKKQPVPERGWEKPVRVCNNCINDEKDK